MSLVSNFFHDIRKYYIFLPLICFLLSSSIYGYHDAELSTSLRCVGLFRKYEYQYRIPADALYSIALQETGKLHSEKKIKIVWPWTVNVEGEGYFFNTKYEAVRFVKQQLMKGISSIDVGCMQVNLKHHPEAFKSIEDAFEPKHNIDYGAKFLRSKYDQLGNWHKAIAHYHSATDSLGKKYKDNVIHIASNIDKYKSPFLKQPKVAKECIKSSQPKVYKNSVGKRYSNTLANDNLKRKRNRSDMMVHVPQRR